MALFIPSGSVVVAINGTVDGLVYYQGHGGNIIRRWVYPTNTITPERTAVRSQFASLISLFNSFTPAMMHDWNIAAAQLRNLNRLGQAYTPSGIQYFITTNMNLLSVGLLPILLPEPVGAPPAVIAASLSITGAGAMNLTLNLFAAAVAMPANTFAVVASTDNKTAHRRSCTNRYRSTHILSPGNPLTNNFGPDWLATWAPSLPVSGDRIFFRIHTVNALNGQSTKVTYVSALVP